MLVPASAKPGAEPSKPASTQPADSSPARPGPLFGVSLGAGLNLGTLPTPVFALELDGKALWQSFGLAATARYLAPGDTVDAKQRGVTLQAVGAGLHGLWRPAPLWEARVGVAAFLLFGEGLGSPSLSSGAAWTGGPTLGLAFAPLQSPLFWGGLAAEAQINVLRAQFEILKYKRVFEVSPVSGCAFARFGVHW